MDTPRRFVLGHHTFADIAPPEFISLAAEAGYDAVSLRLWPAYKPPLELPYPVLGTDSPMRKEALARLKSMGIKVQDIEVIRLEPGLDVAKFRPVFEAGAELGGRYLNVLGNDSDRTRLVDNLCALAGMGAEYGIRIALEFYLLNSVNSIQTANSVIDDTARDDVVLTLDTMHLYRSGGCAADVARTDPKRLPSLQLCDAPAVAPQGRDQFRAESRDRLHPSLGELPLVEYVRAAPRSADIIAEAPMPSLREKMAPSTIARDLLILSKAVVKQADTLSDLAGEFRFSEPSLN